jgi:hypothetical protein
MSKLYYNTAIIKCETEEQAEKLFKVLQNEDNLFNSKLPNKSEDKAISSECAIYENSDENYYNVIYKINTPSFAPIEFFTLISEYYNVNITLCFLDRNLCYANKMVIKNSQILSNKTIEGSSEIDLCIKIDVALTGDIDYENIRELLISEYFSDADDAEDKTVLDIGKNKLNRFMKYTLSIEPENLEKLKKYFNDKYFNVK